MVSKAFGYNYHCPGCPHSVEFTDNKPFSAMITM